jgi:hypothetical protein
MGVSQTGRVQRLPLSRGLVLRRGVLGESGTYRVVAARGAVVDVEVVEAPGLAPGSSLRLTAAAAAAMLTASADVVDAQRQGVRPASAGGVRAVPRIG